MPKEPDSTGPSLLGLPATGDTAGWSALASTLSITARGLDRRLTLGISQQSREALKGFADSLHDMFADSRPSNWRELSHAQFKKAVALSRAGELSIVWAPRVDVVRELVEAETVEGRETVLRARRERILDDVVSEADEVVDSPLSAVREARTQTLQAVAAARAGFDAAGQALLAAALTQLLQSVFASSRLGTLRRKFEERTFGEMPVTQMRLACLQMATINALTDTSAESIGFNRHGTAHGLAAYFSDVSMLAGCLLCVGWLRELSSLHERFPDAFRTM